MFKMIEEQGEHQPNQENLADEFFQKLKTYGAEINDESANNARQILTSDQILDFDRRELAKHLGIDGNNEQLMRNISVDNEFLNIYGKLLKPHLLERTQKVFLENEIQIVQNQEISIDEGSVNAGELSDCEIGVLARKEVRKIVGEILYDKDVFAAQGFFWNVLISKNSPYVLKVERKLKDKGSENYRKISLLRYPIIRDTMGQEFLPKQLVLHIEDKEELLVLQEKVPIEKMIPITGSNIDAFLSGNYGQEIREGLDQGENQMKLRRFVDRATRLYEEKGLVLDLFGNNLFFGVEEGVLDIKLVDYGSFKHKREKSEQDLEKNLNVIKKLKEFLQL